MKVKRCGIVACIAVAVCVCFQSHETPAGVTDCSAYLKKFAVSPFTMAQIFDRQNTIKPEDLAPYVMAAAKVSDMLGNLPRPQVGIVLLDKWDNALYLGSVLSVPYVFLTAGGAAGSGGTSTAAPIVATVHEYGHAIFDAYLTKFGPKTWGEQSEVAHQLGDVRFQLERIKLEWDEKTKAIQADVQKSGLTGAKAAKEIAKRIERAAQADSGKSRQVAEAMARLEKQFAANKQFAATFNVFLAYNELFADVIAVFYAGDGRAMFNTVFRYKSPEELARHIHRDFTSPENELSTWLAKTDDSGLDPRENEHNVLAPVRYFLWKNYLSPEANCKLSKAEILEKLLKAIIREGNTRLTQDIGDLSPDEERKRSNPYLGRISLKLINTRLIDAITKEFPSSK